VEGTLQLGIDLEYGAPLRSAEAQTPISLCSDGRYLYVLTVEPSIHQQDAGLDKDKKVCDIILCIVSLSCFSICL
jgi:hypothetical protein